MRKLFGRVPQHVKTYVATVAVTVLGYVGLTCTKNCVSCYACLPLGAFVLGSLWSKNVKVQFQGFSLRRRKADRELADEIAKPIENVSSTS
jgi:hypothetical protein